MENFKEILIYLSPILFLISLVWIIFLHLKLKKTTTHYQKLLQGADIANLETLWNKHLERIKKLVKMVENLGQHQQKNKKRLQACIQNTSLLRYNALNNTGGDQSFIMVLLDENYNGILLNSLHGRSETRIYAKSIKNGSSHYKLSKEEEKAIKLAQNKK